MADPAQGGAKMMRSKLLRCIGITALGIIIVLGIIVLAIWLIIRPRQLTYTIEDGSIHGFTLSNNTLNATFDLVLRAYNPNSRVAIYYDWIDASVLYHDQPIAYARASPFFQPHHNVTRINIQAVAQSVLVFGSVPSALKQEKLSRGIEMEVDVHPRIRYKVGRWKSRKFRLRISCSPVVLYGGSYRHFDRTYCNVGI